MKNIIYIFLLHPFLTFSQSYTIEYDVVLNVLARKGLLAINDSLTSFYYEIQDEKLFNEQEMDKEGAFNKTIYLGNHKQEKRFQIYKKDNDTLFNVDYLQDKQVLYSEVFSKIVWKLEAETKIISNYLCNKASAVFRGRGYTAWFTSDLPINFGPWKFNNLPGAILQVYDDSKTYSWTAIKIMKNKKDKNLVIDRNLKLITLREFVEQDEKLKRERSNRLLLKYIQRGSEVVERKYNRGREKIYEWEK